MAHDVFISYSHEDQTTANAMLATLESHGIRCWIDYRDALPGMDYEEAIIDAIDEAKALVLIFSSHSNESVHIKREVERAVSLGLSVLNFRTEDIAPSKTLEYLISTPHWLDAMTPPLEDHLTRLADTLTVLLAKKGWKRRHHERPATIAAAATASSWRSSRILFFALITSLAAAVVALVAVVIWTKVIVPPKPQMCFFSSAGKTPPPVNERTYDKRFPTAGTEYVWCELTNMPPPSTPYQAKEPLTATVSGPNGKVVLGAYPAKPTNMGGSGNSQIFGPINVKNWKQGIYPVAAQHAGKEVTTGSFQMANEGVKRETMPANVIFEDPFTIWPPSWGPLRADISVKDGKLTFTPDKGKREMQMYRHANLPNDMEASYSVTFVKAGDPTQGAGLAFWAKDYNDYYALLTSPDGWFSIRSYTYGRMSTILRQQDDNLKKGEGAENQIELITEDNQGTIFINGKEVANFPFPDQPPEDKSFQIGFEVYSGPEGQNTVAFSDFRVVQP